MFQLNLYLFEKKKELTTVGSSAGCVWHLCNCCAVQRKKLKESFLYRICWYKETQPCSTKLLCKKCNKKLRLSPATGRAPTFEYLIFCVIHALF